MANTDPGSAGPTYGGIDVPADCWGVDTAIAGILTDAQLRTLAEFDLGTLKVPGYATKGRPIVLWGYVPYYVVGRPVKPGPWDWTAERLRASCDAGFLCGAVQHCRSGLWVASEQQGIDDGNVAAEIASLISYGSDCNLAQDDEAVRNPGPEAYASVTGWCRTLRTAAAAEPATYEGFEPGLTPEQEYENPYVNRYWGAMGPWNVATRSVCCRQGPTVRIGGVAYDLDHFFPDKLGGVMRLMGRTDLHPAAAA